MEEKVEYSKEVKAYMRLYKAIINEERRKLADCIPDFVIDESLRHFERSEQYEKCSVIKSFFDKHPKRVFHMTRMDWMAYGWNLVRS